MPDLEEMVRNPDGLLFVGVGNVLKRDDGVGVYICRGILPRPGIRTLAVEVSIENYIGKINSLDPSRMVIIDATELGAGPGEYRLLSLDEIADHTFHTHGISLKRMREFFPFPSDILGIQPDSLEFGDRLTSRVKRSADSIIKAINQ